MAALDEAALPPAADPGGALAQDRFLLRGEHGALWFEGRSDTLIVAFDNLATLDDPWPRLPWMHGRIAAMGHSILGVQSFRKDWFRQPTTPAQLRALAEAGFFARFRRVLFTGASMGGFAAFNFAPFVPGARVLAFSPQSTMSQTICPFEKRFGYAVTRSNWTEAPFLDAAAAVPYVAQAAVVYDPFVPEDRAHMARLRAPHVLELRTGHFTHQAVRFVLKCDALVDLIADYAETGAVGPWFWRRLRARRAMRAWRRSFVETLAKRNHPRATLAVCDRFLAEEAYLFAHRARKDVLAKHPELAVHGPATPAVAGG